MRYLIAFIGVTIGAVIVIKSEWLLEQMGRVEWAEQKFSGGSRTFYKLFGLGVVLASLFYMSGILQDAVTFIFIPKAQQ